MTNINCSNTPKKTYSPILLLKKLLVKMITSPLKTADYKYYSAILTMPKFNWKKIHSEKPIKNKINVAFCFDKNVRDEVLVVIGSLLLNSVGICSYNIYCITNKIDNQKIANLVSKIDKNSNVYFIEPLHDFDDARNPCTGMYYRLMLPKLLPDCDRVIYCDIDTCFTRSLSATDSINIGDNLIAAVNEGTGSVLDGYDKFDTYFNSGFLIMNLKQMRAENTYKKLVALRQEPFGLFDQDILNIVCRNRVCFIPPIYNFQPEMIQGLIGHGLMNLKSYKNLKLNLTMIHYPGGPKPYTGRRALGWVYKKYAEKIKVN